MDKTVASTYGNRVRVRACGICLQENRLLMVNHRGLTDGDFWAPPGGGVEFGQATRDAVEKEFREETGLVVKVGEFLFAGEYIGKPIHSVELFFHVTSEGGKLRTGHDPELDIIEEVRFMTLQEIRAFADRNVHGLFRHVSSLDDLLQMRGFFPL